MCIFKASVDRPSSVDVSAERVDRVSVDSVDRCHEDTWKNDQMSSTKYLLDC